MIILIAGASHTGKTVLAQKLLARCRYPVLENSRMGKEVEGGFAERR